MQKNFTENLPVPAKRKLEILENDADLKSSKIAEPAVITKDEVALYDRQIRLWGIEAQQRYEIDHGQNERCAVALFTV